jgi:hypothetical protein
VVVPPCFALMTALGITYAGPGILSTDCEVSKPSTKSQEWVLEEQDGWFVSGLSVILRVFLFPPSYSGILISSGMWYSPLTASIVDDSLVR